MIRTPVRTRAALGLLAVCAAVLLFDSHSEVSGTLTLVLPVIGPLEEPKQEAMPVDTPPPRPAAGWPFQQLPLVMKFEVPAPHLRTPQFALLTPMPRLAVQPMPLPSAAPAPAGGGVSPLWLLPLAAGAAAGSADDVAGATTVIPEPATLVLTSTGLLLLGFRARRRRRSG